MVLLQKLMLDYFDKVFYMCYFQPNTPMDLAESSIQCNLVSDNFLIGWRLLNSRSECFVENLLFNQSIEIYFLQCEDFFVSNALAPFLTTQRRSAST